MLYCMGYSYLSIFFSYQSGRVESYVLSEDSTMTAPKLTDKFSENLCQKVVLVTLVDTVKGRQGRASS